MSIPARADMIAYNKVVDLWAEAGSLRAEHHHDWSSGARDSRWQMMFSAKNPFGADNDYSYLRLRDNVTDTELFRRPVPALTHIWISPNSKYVVGISNVKLRNPYQLVVFSKAGDLLLKRNMVGAICRESGRASQTGSTGIRSRCRKSPSLKRGRPLRSLSKIRVGPFVSFNFLRVASDYTAK